MNIRQADIIYEDNHLIVVNKQPGILVQGDITGDKPLVELVKEFLKMKYQKPGNVFAGLVHRIDRPVSGLVLFAKTSKALERMSKIFHDRQVEKKYLAIVNGNPEPEIELNHWLKKNEKTNKATIFYKPKGDAKPVSLAYRKLAELSGDSLLEVVPYTGRPHQIRAQLSYTGTPIKGDLKYGSAYATKDKSICLHAHSLSFKHPVQDKHVEIVAPFPESMDWVKFK